QDRVRRGKPHTPSVCARTPPARRIRATSAGAADCRTQRQNSHGIAARGDERVAYGRHPWVGQTVRVHDVIEKAAGSVTRCSLADDGVRRAQEIPAWMLDAAFCQTMRDAAHPVADLSALIELRALLSDATAVSVPTAAEGEPAIASPD